MSVTGNLSRIRGLLGELTDEHMDLLKNYVTEYFEKNILSETDTRYLALEKYIADKKIRQFVINSLYYYGTVDITPTPELLEFEINSDGTTATAIMAFDEYTFNELYSFDIVIPYEYVDDNGNKYIVNCVKQTYGGYYDSINSISIPSTVTKLDNFLHNLYIRDFSKCVLNFGNVTEITDGTFTGSSNEGMDKVADTFLRQAKNLTAVGDYCISDCGSGGYVDLFNVESIGVNLFDLRQGQFIIVCHPGSYAEQYAKDNNIKYVYDTTDVTKEYVDDKVTEHDNVVTEEIKDIENSLVEVKTDIDAMLANKQDKDFIISAITNGNDIALDKTFEEIQIAYKEGRHIYINANLGSWRIIPCVTVVEDEFIIFSTMMNERNRTTLIINFNNTCELSEQNVGNTMVQDIAENSTNTKAYPSVSAVAEYAYSKEVATKQFADIEDVLMDLKRDYAIGDGDPDGDGVYEW